MDLNLAYATLAENWAGALSSLFKETIKRSRTSADKLRI